MTASPLLEVAQLAKAYGDTPILAEITFSLTAGEFLSLVGPSGCGKTTLLMALAGLTTADSGGLRFAGAPLGDGTPPGMAVVFQDYSRSLLPWRTNLDNVLFGMRRSTESRRAKRERGRDLLAAVGIGDFADHYPWQVSGGMQQRVAIARGLAARPSLLLLDEPLAAVDAQTRAEMQDLLLELARTFRQSCLLVTHDVDEAVYMADRVLVLSARPTRVVEVIPVTLGRPRDQLTTRESPAFLALRHRVLELIRGQARGQDVLAA